MKAGFGGARGFHSRALKSIKIGHPIKSDKKSRTNKLVCSLMLVGSRSKESCSHPRPDGFEGSSEVKCEESIGASSSQVNKVKCFEYARITLSVLQISLSPNQQPYCLLSLRTEQSLRRMRSSVSVR